MRWAICAAATIVLTSGPAAAQAIDDADKCYEGGRGHIDPDRAIHHCTRAIRSGKLSQEDLAITYNNRGSVYDDKGQYDRAIQDYDQAVRLDPNYANAYNNRGIAYANKGQYDRAIQEYNQGLSLDPDDAIAYNNRGNAHADKGQYDRAIQDFNQAIRLDPDYAYAYNNRGSIYNAKRQFDRAIQDFNQALRLDPDYAYAYNNRGNAYERKGQYDRAIQDYTQVLRLDSANSWSLNSLAWLLATVANGRYRDGPAAVRYSERAIALNDIPTFRGTLAAAYAEAGRYADAVREQERAIAQLRAAGRDDEVADYRGRLDLYRQGRPYRE
jgi:tetratricopeptide (TPR) repeat protein